MNLTFLVYIKAWMYSWFWNDLLNFLWALPATIMVTLKLIISTWLGFWLLPIAQELNIKNESF